MTVFACLTAFGQTGRCVLIDTTSGESRVVVTWDGNARWDVADSSGYVSMNQSLMRCTLEKMLINAGDTLVKDIHVAFTLKEVVDAFNKYFTATGIRNKLYRQVKRKPFGTLRRVLIED